MYFEKDEYIMKMLGAVPQLKSNSSFLTILILSFFQYCQCTFISKLLEMRCLRNECMTSTALHTGQDHRLWLPGGWEQPSYLITAVR